MRIDRREVPLFCLYHLHMSFDEIADMDENCRCRREYREGFIDHYMRIWHNQFVKTGLAAGREPDRPYLWQLHQLQKQRLTSLKNDRPPKAGEGHIPE